MADTNTKNAEPKTAPAPQPSDLEVLKTRAETAEQERDQFRNLAQRTRADFENYQKRAQRDREQERLFAQVPLAEDLLPVLDNLERAVAAGKQAGEQGPLVQGVAMALSQWMDVFRRHGITRIEAQGAPFDPHLHQAVMQQPTAEQPPMTVLQVLETGYKMHDRVLRPARVVVAVAPGS
jgi:molecular chaperone GrpE